MVDKRLSDSDIKLLLQGFRSKGISEPVIELAKKDLEYGLPKDMVDLYIVPAIGEVNAKAMSEALHLGASSKLVKKLKKLNEYQIRLALAELKGGMLEDSIIGVITTNATAHDMERMFTQIKKDMSGAKPKKEGETKQADEAGESNIGGKPAAIDADEVARAIEPIFERFAQGIVEAVKPNRESLDEVAGMIKNWETQMAESKNSEAENRLNDELDRLEKQVDELKSDLASSAGVIKSKEEEISRLREEMGQVFLNTNDDIIVIDPMNEYFDIAKTFGGAIVNMSAYTKNYVNPLDADLAHINEKGIRDVIADKSEFMLGICDQLLGSTLNQKHHSIIDRCVRELYMGAFKTRKVPLMTDFYHILKSQTEMEAQELDLCLELFVEGSLNIFNHHTNVDEDNRFTVYGIQDLGTQLAPVAMLVMMEAIQSRIIENGKKGRATWLYVDECHVLLNSEYSATYLQQLWKKVRKQGGLCTGISQNVTDLLQNYIASTLISNSEFITLLKQSNIDSAKLAEVIGVSDAQLRFVSNAPSGTGLIKCGTTVIPFDNTIGKDTDLYKLYNTNIHEKIAMGLAGSACQTEDYETDGEEEIADGSAAQGNSWLIY